MDIRKLLWSKTVIGKIQSKHNISPQEVGQVCRGQKWVLRGREGTYYLLGQTEGGRYLLAVLAQKGHGRYKVVTAREMKEAEKKRFKERSKRELGQR